MGFSYNTTSGLNSLSFAYSSAKDKINNIRNDKGDVIANNMKSSGFNGGFGYSFASPTYMPLSGPKRKCGHGHQCFIRYRFIWLSS